jgi:hypothetical protein
LFLKYGQIQTDTLEGRKATMKTTSLPPDTDMLLSIAESVAWVLAERQEELGIKVDAEASCGRVLPQQV